MNFKDLTTEVFKEFYEDGRSDKIVASAIKELVLLIGERTNIKKIDHKVIQDLIKTFKKNGNSNATINRKLAVLSKCLTYAYQVKYIEHKPLIPRKQIDDEKIRFLSEDEQKQIVGYFKEHYPILADITVFAINTGMRISEILSLEYDNIDSGYIRLYANKTKNKVTRSIPMTEAVKEIVERNKPLLFGRITYTIVYNNWIKMLAATGLGDDVTIHTLRHTFCSRLVQRGVDLYKVQKLAGHKSQAITQRYAHLRDEDLEDAIKVL